VDNERYDQPIAMLSVVDSVGKRFEQYSSKILVDSPVGRSMLVNMTNVRIENREEPITQSLIPFFVVPLSGFGCVVKDTGEKTEVAQARIARILFWNSSSVSAALGS
jgi:hypothetical protein